MVPHTYDEWKDCIVNDCKIPLTKTFAKKRLDIYENKSHAETRKFKELYGDQHLSNIIYWYKRFYNE